MRDLRNTERVVDAGKQAEALNKMDAELQLDLIRMEQEYIVQRRTVAGVGAATAGAAGADHLFARPVEATRRSGHHHTVGSPTRRFPNHGPFRLPEASARRSPKAPTRWRWAISSARAWRSPRSSFISPVPSGARRPLYPSDCGSGRSYSRSRSRSGCRCRAHHPGAQSRGDVTCSWLSGGRPAHMVQSKSGGPVPRKRSSFRAARHRRMILVFGDNGQPGCDLVRAARRGGIALEASPRATADIMLHARGSGRKDVA